MVSRRSQNKHYANICSIFGRSTWVSSRVAHASASFVERSDVNDVLSVSKATKLMLLQVTMFLFPFTFSSFFSEFFFFYIFTFFPLFFFFIYFFDISFPFFFYLYYTVNKTLFQWPRARATVSIVLYHQLLFFERSTYRSFLTEIYTSDFKSI